MVRQAHSVYEVHLGSWKRHVEENRFLTYLEFANDLVNYVKETGFTYVLLWNIRMIRRKINCGLFCPTSRFGNHRIYVLNFITRSWNWSNSGLGTSFS
jgi:1,4-alpha-glucan branching enzyme